MLNMKVAVLTLNSFLPTLKDYLGFVWIPLIC